MADTTIVTSISRTDEFPIKVPVTVSNNNGYITLDTSKFTAKMFYELPAIKFEIYTDTDDTKVKYKSFCKVFRTYNPIFPPDLPMIGTIDVKDIPNSFYLYITPIFDNNSIPARNELIKNGIENGEIWNTSTNTFDITINFNEYTEPGPSHKEITIKGIPPITIPDNYGDYLSECIIYGNNVQNGTPTQDNPIIPDFVGARTANLFDRESVSYPTGTAIKYFPIEVPDGTYTLSTNFPDFDTKDIFFLAGNVSSGASSSSNGVSISTTRTRTAENGYVTIAMRYNETRANPADYDIMLNSGSTALPYEPYGYKILITCAGQTTPIYLGQTQTVRRIKKYEFTGDEQWFVTAGKFYLQEISPDYLRAADAVTYFCSHFPVYPQTNRASNVPNNMLSFGSGSATQRVYCTYTGVSTTEEFKSYLAAQYAAGTPVVIWYVLAEPETGIVNEPLAKIGDYADELTVGSGIIPMSKGTNVLTVDTTVQPSEVSVTYTAN